MFRFLRNKKGSSLVMVLIMMSMMTILGVTVISMTITNMRMKYAQAGSQKEFYKVEGAMDAIIAGLENDSEECASYAYANTLSKYSSNNSSASTSDLEENYNNQFFRFMVYKLCGFNVEKIANGDSYPLADIIADTSANFIYAYRYDTSTGTRYAACIGGNNAPYYVKGDGNIISCTQKAPNGTVARDQFGYTLTGINEVIDYFLTNKDGTSRIYYQERVLANYVGRSYTKGTTLTNGRGASLTGYYMPSNGDSYKTNGVVPYDNVMLFEYDDEGNPCIILKNVRLRSPSTNQSYASVTTDIRITCPQTEAEAFTRYMDYAVIADDQIKVSQSAQIEGNLYAGTVNRGDNPDDSDADNGTAGIIVNNSELNISAEELITRGDIVVKNRGRFHVYAYTTDGSVKNSVYAENIKTERVGNVGENEIYIDGSTYVTDDFELNAPSDTALLAGEYYGYSYTDLNSAVAPDPTTGNGARFSSTMTLNGGSKNKVNVLDIEGLTKLVLAGKTYISKAGDDEAYGTKSDILLNEGLTVKSSQLVYMIPAKYINAGTAAPADWNSPIHATLTAGGTVWFDQEGYCTKYLGGAPLTDFIDSADLSTCVYSYFRNKAGIKGAGNADVTSIQYYYLKISDSVKAESFYNTFMDNAPTGSQIEEVSSNIGIISNIDASTIITTAGNILYNTAGGGTLQVGNSDPTDVDSTLAMYSRSINKDYLSLQMSLLKNYSTAETMVAGGQYRLYDDANATDKTSVTADGYSKSGRDAAGNKVTNIFDFIIDRTKLTDVLTANGGKIETVVDAENEDGDIVRVGIYISNEDFEFDGKINGENVSRGIIITTKNVDMKQNFNGLVLAGGDVSFSSAGIIVSSDSEAVDAAINWDAEKEEVDRFISNVFKDSYKSVVNPTIKSGDDFVRHNVKTENWVKNDMTR